MVELTARFLLVIVQTHHQGEDECVAHDAVGAVLECGKRVPALLSQLESLALR
eukprot:m.44434 g.44434  ORF g.44434 m.44434 type:complete len:53 (+) comp14970_c0_seq3:94-252(+)